MDASGANRRVRAIYARLAERPIERACSLRSECCHFKLTGQTPYLTRGEALLAAQAVRAAGRRSLPERSDGACPLLHPQTNRCLIYDGRPFGCRTHYCRAAGGPYARGEVADLIRELEDIDHELGGRGAMSLPLAISRALETLPRRGRR